MHDKSWQKIFDDYHIEEHDFDAAPYKITATQIKRACQNFTETGEKEVRILCKQDTRESRPAVFKKLGLFLLPVKNGEYVIIKGEGYVDIPPIEKQTEIHRSKLQFKLDTVTVGNSEMQHLDFAYAASLIRTFLSDDTLVLTIRGRKYTPSFDFYVGKHQIKARSVQTEVDAGYEGKAQIVLIEAKNTQASNVIIRQLYYPYRQWQSITSKKVIPMFFDKVGDIYSLWQFEFKDLMDYNSISLVKSGKFKIVENQ
ncbi:MAG: hypothetical protein KBG49_07460 [Spirochaetes bacterium]|nr:hypothetical protein [Spirochaetota bacterium]